MANLKAVYTKPLASLDDLGQQLAFYIRALVAAPAAAVPVELLREAAGWENSWTAEWEDGAEWGDGEEGCECAYE